MNPILSCKNKASIFDSITELGDEEINLYNNDNDDDDDDKLPLTISIGEILEKYICHNNNHHISILTMLKIIDDNITNNNNDIIKNISYIFHKIYIPKYSLSNNIPLL